MSAEISSPAAPANAESVGVPQLREDEPTPQLQYAHASWRALGTYVQLVVARGDLFEAARQEAVKVLAQVDAGCSRFRDDSDLSRANRGSGRWVKVDPILAEALEAALWAANETNGLVDPTLGRNLAAIGYDRDLKQVQAGHGPAAIPLPAVTEAWRQVEVRVDGEQAEVLVPFGVALDLGATGKGFTADLVARRIVENVGTDLVVSIGGDVAIGSVDPDGEPQEWPIAVGEAPGGRARADRPAQPGRDGDVVHPAPALDPRGGQPSPSS